MSLYLQDMVSPHWTVTEYLRLKVKHLCHANRLTIISDLLVHWLNLQLAGQTGLIVIDGLG